MNEFNIRTALNRRLRQDAEATRRQAEEARGKQMIRCINRAYRKSVTIVAINAALIGASLVGCIAAVAYLICVAVM